jgi:hypothetical protein
MVVIMVAVVVWATLILGMAVLAPFELSGDLDDRSHHSKLENLVQKSN